MSSKYKIGDRVITPDGRGEVLGDNFNKYLAINLIEVELDNPILQNWLSSPCFANTQEYKPNQLRHET